MDGMLSQDEINALLQGMDLSDTADGGDAAADPAPENSTAENIIMRMKLRRTQHRLSVTERN